ncbi:MAG: hypothetical protein QXF24_06265 [Thermoproteota archaeon]
MATRKRLVPEDFLLLRALPAKGGTVKSLASSTSLDGKLVRRRVGALRKLGLVSTKPEASRTYFLTPLGSKLVETGDAHLVEPYSPGEEVTRELGFRFAVGEGLYTGDVARSYAEFADLAGKVDARALAFHLHRGDFERWVLDVFKDGKTARKLRRLALRPVQPDRLRPRLIRIFAGRAAGLEEKQP